MGRYYDNYPPGFNGKFPWDDDVCFLDYNNVFESTLQWLEENPNEFETDPKKLFLAMGGTLRTQNDWEDFSYLKSDIQKAINTFNAKDNVVNECKKNKKNAIRLTESELKKVITESVKKVLSEKVNSFGQQIIELPGIPSTISIMEYIRENNGPTVGKMQFSFENGKMLICTPLPQDDDILEYYLEEYPLESWHDISGMKRIKCNHGWICYINNRFYHLS